MLDDETPWLVDEADGDTVGDGEEHAIVLLAGSRRSFMPNMSPKFIWSIAGSHDD